MLQNLFKKKNIIKLVCNSEEFIKNYNKENLSLLEKKAKNEYIKDQSNVKLEIAAENLSLMWSDIF